MKRLSASGAAEELGISVQHVCALARRGVLAFEPTPLGRLYRSHDVERLKHERARRALRDRRVKSAAR